MDFRECDIFDFGTARTKGGISSNRDFREGIDQAEDAKKGMENNNDLERRPLRATAAMVVWSKDIQFRLRNSPWTTTMFRATRPLANVLKKRSTGITGLAVHPNPLPHLSKTYEETLKVIASIPSSSIYRQGVEALTLRKLNIIKSANQDVALVERQLEEGQIEQALDIASDELSLAIKMVEWKA
ncbi:hypothetical protein H0H93_012520 [Arthromyces matolae]|nr:hypothetical protein H0H93_012520 [Arthromyces matolae]